MKNVCSIVTLLVFTNKWHFGKGSCTERDISNCAQPLAVFNLTSAPIVPTRSEQQMRDLCQAYNTVEKCLGSIEQDCDATQRQRMKTVDNQYDYICDKYFDEYLKHRPCLAKSDLHKDATQCNETLSGHFVSIKQSNESNSYKRERLCQYVHQYINCIYITVRGYCSEETAEWQKGLDLLTVLPAFSSLNCPIFGLKKSTPVMESGKSNTTIIIIAVIVVGVACLVLVGSMTAFFIHRKRKADQKRAAHEMLNVTRRDPHHSRCALPAPNYDEEDNTQEGAEGNIAPPSDDFFAPPPYLEKEVPPPSYRNPPNYDVFFAGTADATGVAVNQAFHKEKV